jgi:hypothetical protein
MARSHLDPALELYRRLDYCERLATAVHARQRAAVRVAQGDQPALRRGLRAHGAARNQPVESFCRSFAAQILHRFRIVYPEAGEQRPESVVAARPLLAPESGVRGQDDAGGRQGELLDDLLAGDRVSGRVGGDAESRYDTQKRQYQESNDAPRRRWGERSQQLLR